MNNHITDLRFLMKNYNYEYILKQWNLDFLNERSDLNISGSPDRTEFRIVIKDKNKDLFVLEQICKDLYKHKLLICKTLDHLSNKGLKKVQPYLKNNYEEYISEFNGEYWQLTPYIQNITLIRPEYVFDNWRGIVLADFLLDFWKYGENITFFDKYNPFDLRKYFLNMINKMQIYNKTEYDELRNCIRYLEDDFLNIYYDIPILFCHGDYHPLNIIWSKKNIRYVIDWEFLGYKSEVYDIANLLGCIGIEDPKGLIGDLAKSFISRIRRSDIISDLGFEYLIDFIIILRFAWLAEWLRKKDYEMINLEIDYIKLLTENRDPIKKSLELL